MTRPFANPGFRSGLSRRGFTLLELLLALAMSAILAASMFACIRTAFKARNSSEAAVEPGRAAESAMELIRLDLENALSPNTTNTKALAGNFEGQDNSDGDLLDLYTTAEGPLHSDGNGEIKLVELAIETIGKDRVLVRRAQRNISPLATNPPPPDEEVLCRGVSGFNLRYFDSSVWQDAWDSAQYNDALPAAVEVTLDLQRLDAGGTMKTFRFVRVFALSCSPLTPGSNGGIGGTGSSGGLSF